MRGLCPLSHTHTQVSEAAGTCTKAGFAGAGCRRWGGEKARLHAAANGKEKENREARARRARAHLLRMRDTQIYMHIFIYMDKQGGKGVAKGEHELSKRRRAVIRGEGEMYTQRGRGNARVSLHEAAIRSLSPLEGRRGSCCAMSCVLSRRSGGRVVRTRQPRKSLMSLETVVRGAGASVKAAACTASRSFTKGFVGCLTGNRALCVGLSVGRRWTSAVCTEWRTQRRKAPCRAGTEGGCDGQVKGIHPHS